MNFEELFYRFDLLRRRKGRRRERRRETRSTHHPLELSSPRMSSTSNSKTNGPSDFTESAAWVSKPSENTECNRDKQSSQDDRVEISSRHLILSSLHISIAKKLILDLLFTRIQSLQTGQTEISASDVVEKENLVR